MANRNQTLTLKRHAKVNWLPPSATKVVPAIVVRVRVDDNHADTVIQVLRAGGGYVKGDLVDVSAKNLSARGT